jgi:hypothetical protein
MLAITCKRAHTFVVLNSNGAVAYSGADANAAGEVALNLASARTLDVIGATHDELGMVPCKRTDRQATDYVRFGWSL